MTGPSYTHDPDNGRYLIDIDEDTFDEIWNKDTSSLAISIDDNTYRDLLQNIEGNLVLCVDEMPTTFHGCYLWNGGNFPYLLKPLKELVIQNGREVISAKITSMKPEAYRRFNLQHPDVDDPNGDSCNWVVVVEFEVVLQDILPCNTYLLRWNPAISSFTEDNYCDATRRFHDSFCMNWSIYDWEDARKGDNFYMIRVGDGKNTGIVFHGKIISDPYTDEDWAGSTKQRHYVDIECCNCCKPGGPAWLSVDELTAAFPEISWGRGHSGELISADVAAGLIEMFDKALTKHKKRK